MAPKIGLKLSMQANAKAAFQMLRQWPTRWKNFRAQMMYDVATFTMKSVQQKIPNGLEFQDYKKSIRVAEVVGMPMGMQGFAVESAAKSSQLMDASGTLLYVKARRAKAGPSRALVLEQFGPWTVDTIPFIPTKDEAVVLRRKVRRKEVARVSTERRQSKSRWSAALSKLGVQIPEAQRQTVAKGKQIPEFMQKALGLEFPDIIYRGAKRSGGSSAPWRRTLIELVRREMPRFLERRPRLERWVTDPSSKDWLTPSRAPAKINFKQLKDFDRFQRLVAPQLGGS